MKFPKDVVRDVCYDESPEFNGKVLETVEKTLTDSSRWDLRYDVVFAYDGKFYFYPFSEGATEQQDYDCFDMADDEIDCTEVEPVEKTITVYQAVKKVQ